MRRSMRLMRFTDFCRPAWPFSCSAWSRCLTLAARSAPRPGARRPGCRRRLRDAAPDRRPTKPDYWALYIYIAVVTAAAFALARARLWLWLAVTAIVLSALWTLPARTTAGRGDRRARFQRACRLRRSPRVFLVCGLLYGPGPSRAKSTGSRASSLAVYLLVTTFFVLASRQDSVPLTAFVILTVATIAVAWRTEAATAAVAVAAILASR